MGHAEAGRLGYLKSKEAQQAAAEARKQAYAIQPTKCKTCQVALPYDKRHHKFCGHSCSARCNNLGEDRHARHRGASGAFTTNPEDVNCVVRVRTPQSCKVCGKQTTSKYCSHECSTAAQRLRSRNKILETGSFAKVCSKGPAKRYMLETQGHNCAICGITEWQGKPAPLLMDHIDGNSSNNKIDNIRLVCGNCDMQLPTYKNKNKGKGRAYRRARYAEGKTY